jgi:hypothetical protein
MNPEDLFVAVHNQDIPEYIRLYRQGLIERIGSCSKSDTELMVFYHEQAMKDETLSMETRKLSRQWLWENHCLQFKPPITNEEYVALYFRQYHGGIIDKTLAGKTLLVLSKDGYSQAKHIQKVVNTVQNEFNLVRFDMKTGTLYFVNILIVFLITTQSYDPRLRSFDATNTLWKLFI